MIADDFAITLHQIINAHDAAARNRRKWRYAAAVGVTTFIIASYLIH